jgi:hypothetical protein
MTLEDGREWAAGTSKFQFHHLEIDDDAVSTNSGQERPQPPTNQRGYPT